MVEQQSAIGGKGTQRVLEGVLRSRIGVGDTEQPRQFRFEMVHGPQAGSGCVHMVERPLQQVVQLWFRVVGFHGEFKQLAKVRGQQGGGILAAEAFPPRVNDDLAEGMQLAALRPGKGDFAAEKQVELASKRAGWAAGRLGHGFEQPVVLGEPVDNQAGVRQAGEPDKNGQSRLHGQSIDQLERISKQKDGCKVLPGSPFQAGGGPASSDPPLLDDPPVRQVEHTVGHFRHDGVVGDDDRERAKVAVDPFDRL